MKKVNFGYSNDAKPSGSWEGVGLSPYSSLVVADYCGAFKSGNDHYVVVKVAEDEVYAQPEFLGKYFVLPAVADLYCDGSGSIFVSQDSTAVSRHMEEILNESENKDRFTNIRNIIDEMRWYMDAYRCDRAFEIITDYEYDYIKMLGITKKAFDRKNTAYKNCRSSITELSAMVNDMFYDDTYNKPSNYSDDNSDTYGGMIH